MSFERNKFQAIFSRIGDIRGHHVPALSVVQDEEDQDGWQLGGAKNKIEENGSLRSYILGFPSKGWVDLATQIVGFVCVFGTFLG